MKSLPIKVDSRHVYPAVTTQRRPPHKAGRSDTQLDEEPFIASTFDNKLLNEEIEELDENNGILFSIIRRIAVGSASAFLHRYKPRHSFNVDGISALQALNKYEGEKHNTSISFNGS